MEQADVSLIRLRSAVEATRLNFGLGPVDVRDLVRQAVALGARGVCIPPLFVADAAREVENLGYIGLDVVSVANFPTGDHSRRVVHLHIEEAVTAGANQIDVVVPGASVAAQAWRDVSEFVRQVRETAESAAGVAVAIKVILETAAWDDEQIRAAAASSVEGGADWLKTSTGFHPKGGATLEAVQLLRANAPPAVGVKASGGIRTRALALRFLEAGADRIGTSAERQILAG